MKKIQSGCQSGRPNVQVISARLLSIGFLWVWTGIVSLGAAKSFGLPLLALSGFSPLWQALLLYSGSLVNLILGFATLFNCRIKLVGSLQCLLILIYTLIVSVTLPIFWLHPFAPIAKNIPLFIATLAMIATESQR